MNNVSVKSAVNELSLLSPEMCRFSISDWRKLLGVVFTRKQEALLGVLPEILHAPCPFHPHRLVRDTHVGFIGVDRLTLQEFGRLNCPYPSRPDPWYFKEKFATKETMKFQIYLLLREIVPGSESRTFDDQRRMLPSGYDVPYAIAEAVKNYLLYRTLGVRVNPKRYARTASLNSFRIRAAIGAHGVEGCAVTRFTDHYDSEVLGIAASRILGQEP